MSACIFVSPKRQGEERQPLSDWQTVAGAGGQAGEEANLGAPGDGQTIARGRTGDVQDEMCPAEEADQEAGVRAGEDDAMEGPVGDEESEVACPVTSAHNAGAPIKAEHEKHRLTHMRCPPAHGVHGA